MKLIRIKEIPDGYKYVESAALSEYDIETLVELGIEEARYWYASGSYEGSGQMVALKDGKWFHHDMSHCSCFGPVEQLSLHNGFDSLESLLASCSMQLQKDVLPLIG